MLHARSIEEDAISRFDEDGTSIVVEDVHEKRPTYDASESASIFKAPKKEKHQQIAACLNDEAHRSHVVSKKSTESV